MGLMDILNGMQNGPRGQRQSAAPGSSGGMSPMTMALLGLLAYKAFSSSGGLGNILGGGQADPSGGQGRRAPDPDETTAASASGGGLGDLLGGLLSGGTQPNARRAGNPSDLLGGLGSLLGGASAGSVLTNGLDGLLRDLQSNGQGKVAQSWVGTGRNEEIDPDALENTLGADTLAALERQSGMSRSELLQGLSDNLPDLVDRLTPNGRLPTEEEASRMV
jgi:uncharacterized protein YidB (DUF937 family)